jgi:hypothetical protein
MVVDWVMGRECLQMKDMGINSVSRLIFTTVFLFLAYFHDVVS